MRVQTRGTAWCLLYTYGRFVGDIFVEIAGKKRHDNRWLVEQGWRFPASTTRCHRMKLRA
jgi:hypothetical protein